jgi:hypothetical protein
MSKKTGRPKEEGGHKRHNVSFGKFVSEALSKVSNKSQFLEKIAKPVLEQLDPGPLCQFIQSIDRQITVETEEALKNKDYGKVQALSNFAGWLQDYRGLCELPQPNLSLKPKLPQAKKLELKINRQRSKLPYVNEETYQPTSEDKKLLHMIAKQIS